MHRRERFNIIGTRRTGGGVKNSCCLAPIHIHHARRLVRDRSVANNDALNKKKAETQAGSEAAT